MSEGKTQIKLLCYKLMVMEIQLDSIDVDIPCPNCGAENKVTLAQIKREESINCIGCGAVIHLKDKDGSVKKGTRQVQNALDDLDRTLRRFGRR